MVKINTLGGAGTKKCHSLVIMMREDKFVSQFYMASLLLLVLDLRSGSLVGLISKASDWSTHSGASLCSCSP